MPKKLQIFVSSPGDVGLERNLAMGVLERLQGEFGQWLSIEPIFWEDRPFRATETFQSQIIPPSETDIVVSILWSRLGTPLPESFQRPDGTRYASGTEWEFEDAARSWREKRAPDLLVYRCTKNPEASRDPKQFQARLAQYQALDAFLQKWFFGEDQSFKAAFKSYEQLDVFERMLENDLRHLLLERLPEHVAESGVEVAAIRWHQGSPFSGLAAFDLERAPVFFGRTRAIAEVKEALVRQAELHRAFLVIFGMSGCGKSSLLRAGVLATITRPGVVEGVDLWRWCIFRPSDGGDSLCQLLASSLLSATALPELTESGVSADELTAILADKPQHAMTPLGMALRRAANKVAEVEGRSLPATGRLVVAVDQLEEIFTLDRVTASERQAFVAALAALAQSGLVWVVATMRSDYYPRCIELPQLVELKDGDGQYDLLPPTFDEVDQMITYPTRAAGLRFEVDPKSGQRLDVVLHEAATKDQHALPLLSFTLDELYNHRTQDGFLTFAAYHGLGGLEGALAQRAEKVYQDQPVEVQATLPALMRGLATVDTAAEEIVAARRTSLEGLAITDERRTMLEALVNARLAVTDRGADGQVVVRVAHEAILNLWPRAKTLLADDREFLRVRSRLTQQADRWNREGSRNDLLLPTGKPLAEAEESFRERRDELDEPVLRYVEASLRRRLRQRMTAFALTAAVGAFLTVVSYVSYQKWDEWSRQTSLTLDQRKANEREQLRLEFEKELNEARVELMNPLPTLYAKDAALNRLEKCREIATRLADVSGEEHVNWTIKLANVLLLMSDAYGMKVSLIRDNDERQIATDAMVNSLQERKRLLASLPTEAQSRTDAAVARPTEFSGPRRALMSLQTELLIANEYLKDVARKKEQLKIEQEVRDRYVPGGAPKEQNQAKTNDAQTLEEKHKEFDEPYNLFWRKQLEIMELLAGSSGDDEDWNLYLTLSITVASRAANNNQFQKAEEIYQRGLASAERILQRALAPKGVPERYRPKSENSTSPTGDPWPNPGMDGRYYVEGEVGLGHKIVDGNVFITEVGAEDPAGRAGLKEKDQIVAIGEGAEGPLQSVQGFTESQFLALMGGRAGDSLRLAIIPAEEEKEQKVLTMVRAATPINKKTVQSAANVVLVHYEIALTREAGKDYAGMQAILERGLSVLPYVTPEHRNAGIVSTVYNARVALARALEAQGQKEQAIPIVKLALEEATSGDSVVATEATHRVVNYYQPASRTLSRMGDATGSRAQLQAAIDWQRRITVIRFAIDEQQKLADLLLSQGDFLEASEGPATAFPYILEASQLYQQMLDSSDLKDARLTEVRNKRITIGLRLFAMLKKQGETEDTSKLAAQIEAALHDRVAFVDASTEAGFKYSEYKETAKAFETLGNGQWAIEIRSKAVDLFEQGLKAVDADLHPLVRDLYDLAAMSMRVGFPERADQAMVRCREVSASTLVKPKDAEFHIRVFAFSASIKLALKDRDGAVDFVRQALELPVPIDDDTFIRTYGTELDGWLVSIVESGRKAEDFQVALRAAQKRRDFCLRLAKVMDDAAAHKKLVAAWELVGDVSDLAGDRPQALEAYAAMRELAEIADGRFLDPSLRDQIGWAWFRQGETHMKLGDDYEPSKIAFDNAMAIWQQTQAANQDPDARRKIALVHRQLARLAEKSNDWNTAADECQKGITILEGIFAETKSEANRKTLARQYGTFGWYKVLCREPEVAIVAIERAISLQPDLVWPAGNMVHAYLLMGKYDQAVEVFEKYKDEKVGEQGSFGDVLLKDFDILNAAGITHPDIDKFRQMIAD